MPIDSSENIQSYVYDKESGLVWLHSDVEKIGQETILGKNISQAIKSNPNLLETRELFEVKGDSTKVKAVCSTFANLSVICSIMDAHFYSDSANKIVM